jgi:hypothetical protein
VLADDLERSFLVDCVALHQDSFGALRERPALERSFEVHLVPELGDELREDSQAVLTLVRNEHS